MPTALSLRFHEHGDPADVLRLEEEEQREPASGEVSLRLIAAPINPSDLGTVQGSYGRLPRLPAVAGREGIAEVVSAGSDVQGLSAGDRVRMPTPGTWRSHLLAKAAELEKVPADIDSEQAAMAFINPPTALLLLSRFVDLNPDCWIIQNAANSAVGACVVQMAKSLGVRTLNLVRREEAAEQVRELGGDAVLIEERADVEAVLKATGGARPVLALNSVGGPSALLLCKALAEDGVHVTFGGMTGDPVRFPTRQLIFNHITLRGFWLDRWLRVHPDWEVQSLKNEIWDFMRKGLVRMPVAASYPLAEWKEAIAHSARPKTGKILLKAE